MVKDEVMRDVGESGSPSAGSSESAPINKIESPQELSTDPQAVVSGSRRRGKRKIMKKKTLRDDEGYLGSYKLQVNIYRFNHR